MKLSTSEFIDRHQFLALWIVGWSAFTLLTLYLLGRDFSIGYRSNGFPSAIGTLAQSAVVADTSGDAGPSYKLKVRYLYEVHGQRFASTRIRWGVSTDASRETAERSLATLRAQKPLSVYYDPADPSRAALRPGLRAMDFAMVAFFYPFVLIMLAGWYFAARAYRIECWETPAAGLAVQQTAHGISIRLDDGQAAVAAFACSFGASILLLIGSNIAGLSNQIATVPVLLALDLVILLSAYLFACGRAPTLLLEANALLYREHGAIERRVQRSDLSAIWVRLHTTSNPEDTSAVRHVVAYATKLEATRDYAIIDFASEERARAFRDWLSAQLVPLSVPAEPSADLLGAMHAHASALPRVWRVPTNSMVALLGTALLALFAVPAAYVTVLTTLSILFGATSAIAWWMYLVALLGVFLSRDLIKQVRLLIVPGDHLFVIDTEAISWGRVPRGASPAALRRTLPGAKPDWERGRLPIDELVELRYSEGTDSDMLLARTRGDKIVRLPRHLLGSEGEAQLLLILRTHFQSLRLVRG